MIDLKKKYQTRDGRPVRVLCVDRRHPTYPVVAVYESEGIESMGTYTDTGHYHVDTHGSRLDIIEVVEPVTVWMNIYDNGGWSGKWPDKESAARNAASGCIARVAITFIPGEGLDHA